MGGGSELSGTVRTWRAGLLCLAALAFFTFWPALANGFVWDDHENLVNNANYHDLRWCLTAFHGGHYQPLTWLSYMADHAVWGMEPRGYHLTSLLLHALNAVLFAFLARALIRTRAEEGQASLGGLVAGAIFALHPMRVESVVWVTERRDVLSGAFCLLALLAYLRKRLALSWVAFLLSLLAKSLALALPVVLLALDWYPLGRSLRDTWREKLPFAALSALFGWLALRAQAAHGALIDTGSHGWPARIAQAAYGLAYYPRSMLAAWWSPLHERPAVLHPGETQFLLSCIAVLAGATLLFVLRRRVPALVTAAVCYVALVAPVLGLAQSGVQLVADRYGYLACLSWAVLAGAGIAQLVHSRMPAIRWVTLVGTAAVLTFWISSSWSYAKTWHDDDRLWNAVLEHGPSAMAANNLGVSALERQDFPAAVERFVEALEILPTYGRAQKNLVDVLEAQPAAIPQATLTRAEVVIARMAAERPAARLSFLLGVLAAQRQDWTQAHAHFLQSTTLNPNKTEAWEYLGLVRARAGDADGAITAYRRATDVDPANGRAWFATGGLLVQQGREADAVVPLRKAAELLPSRSEPLRYLGLCLLRTGDRAGGMEALRQALVRNPQDEEARRLLGTD